MGQRLNIDQTAGTFTKLGLRLEVLYTNASDQAVQAVIAAAPTSGLRWDRGDVRGVTKRAPVWILLAGTTVPRRGPKTA